MLPGRRDAGWLVGLAHGSDELKEGKLEIRDNNTEASRETAYKGEQLVN